MTDYSNEEEVQWMLATQKGDQIAFRKIVEKYQHSLMNFFRFMNAKTERECEDLVQETFMKIYLYREKYIPLAKLSTFLFRIARNTGIDYIRKKKEQNVSFLGGYFEEYLLDTSHQNLHDTKEEYSRSDIEKALMRLPDKLRIVIVMSYFEGFKYQEIADILEIPLGTVKSRMSIAMQQLKDFLIKKDFL